MKRVFDVEFVGRLKLSNEDGLTNLLSGYSDEQKNVIKEIFEHLFRADRKIDTRKSIVYKDNFDLYFDNQLTTEGILFKEFTPVLNKKWIDIKKKFDQWILEKKEAYLIEILFDLNPFELKDRFEKMTYLWISLVNLGIRQENIVNHWIDVISKNFEILKEFYGSDKTFFVSLFKPNAVCFFYDTYPIRLLMRNYIDGKEGFQFPLNVGELLSIAEERLQTQIKESKVFDIRVFNQFYYNCWQGKTKEDKVIISDNANKIIREYINSFPTQYLRFVIRSKFSPHLDGQFVFEPFITSYFGDWDKFEIFLQEVAEREEEFTDMLKYFEEFKKSGYREFYAEPLPRWLEVDENGNTKFKYFKDQTYNNFILKMKEMYG